MRDFPGFYSQPFMSDIVPRHLGVGWRIYWFMPMNVDRRTVDLSTYPNLVVIYLGMHVNRLTGLKTLFGFGPKIANSAAAQPDGLLLHEQIIYSVFPLHVGMRQYWRDMDSLLAWSRSEPHRVWWQSFLKNSGGTGFWHETYLMKGGMEAIYDDVPKPTDSRVLLQWCPLVGRCLVPRIARPRESRRSRWFRSRICMERSGAACRSYLIINLTT